MKTSAESEELVVRYDSWSDDITVENKHLKHVATEYEFDNPARGVPSASRAVIRTDADLTDAQWEDLRRFIRTSGFDALGDAYGAPEGVRYYPYTLIITLGKSTEQVTFRSNPGYESAPEAFGAIQEYLIDLSRQVREAASDELYLMYDSSDDDIEIKNAHIKHVQTQYEFDNPVSAVPTRSRTVELTDSELTQAEHEELVSFIRGSGFDSLAPAYGAPVDRRHYPYVLTIGFGDDRKTVTYRSNPSYDGAPEPFRQIEDYVLGLSRRVRARVGGG
jgi:hypothetical protein